jgi:ubiquinone/menaquinone biosynthesis C-methylase UbiE
MPDDPTESYVLGHRERELRRLSLQHEYWGDFTLDVLRRAGIGPGMRVLDLGSGAGDVAMTAASLVGPSGEVVGVDRSHESVAHATSRASAAELTNIEFIASELGMFRPEGTFDAIIGRFVLMYFPDPAAMLRRLVPSLAPNGVLAFVELDLDAARTAPPVPFIHDLIGWMNETFRRADAALDLGPRLWRVFRTIGFRESEILVHARAEPAPALRGTQLLAETAISLMPMAERFGVIRPGQVDPSTLVDQIREALVGRQGTFIPPNVVGTVGRRASK